MDTSSDDSVKKHLSIAGDVATLQGRLKEKYLLNVSQFFGFAGAIRKLFPLASKATDLDGFVVGIRRLPSNVVWKVLTTPSAFHWNSVTRDFLSTAVSRVYPPALENYLRHSGNNYETGLVDHLSDLGRFSLAAHVLANKEFASEARLHLKLPVSLPGTNLVLLEDKGGAGRISIETLGGSALEQLRICLDSDLPSWIRVGIKRDDFVQVAPIQYCNGKRSKIAIEAYDPCFNLPYVEAHPRIKETFAIERFVSTLKAAMEVLRSYSDVIADEIELVTSVIVPMDSSQSAGEMYSGTSSAIFGGCFISATNDRLQMAEMILHEFCHNKLRLLDEFCPLLTPNTSGEARYYSPWRDDPRPLDGIQHGLYVFSAIAHFWLHVSSEPTFGRDESTIARRRAATLIEQLGHAFEQFRRYAVLTRAGEMFEAEIEDRIRKLKGAISGWTLGDLLPIFSGKVRAEELKSLPISIAVARHRANWEAQYG